MRHTCAHSSSLSGVSSRHTRPSSQLDPFGVLAKVIEIGLAITLRPYLDVDHITASLHFGKPDAVPRVLRISPQIRPYLFSISVQTIDIDPGIVDSVHWVPTNCPTFRVIQDFYIGRRGRHCRPIYIYDDPELTWLGVLLPTIDEVLAPVLNVQVELVLPFCQVFNRFDDVAGNGLPPLLRYSLGVYVPDRQVMSAATAGGPPFVGSTLVL